LNSFLSTSFYDRVENPQRFPNSRCIYRSGNERFAQRISYQSSRNRGYICFSRVPSFSRSCF